MAGGARHDRLDAIGAVYGGRMAVSMHTLRALDLRLAGPDVIVVRDHEELSLALQEAGAGRNYTIIVEIIDRRHAERRQRVRPVLEDRRRGERRSVPMSRLASTGGHLCCSANTSPDRSTGH